MILRFSIWPNWYCRIKEGHTFPHHKHYWMLLKNYQSPFTCITTPSSWGNCFMRLMHPSLWALLSAVQSSIHPRASWRWKKPWTPCRVQPHGRKVKHHWRFICCRIWQDNCELWRLQWNTLNYEFLLSWKDCKINLSLQCMILVKRVTWISSHPKSIPMINRCCVYMFFISYAYVCWSWSSLRSDQHLDGHWLPSSHELCPERLHHCILHIPSASAWAGGLLCMRDVVGLLRFGWLLEFGCFIQYFYVLLILIAGPSTCALLWVCWVCSFNDPSTFIFFVSL